MQRQFDNIEWEAKSVGLDYKTLKEINMSDDQIRALIANKKQQKKQQHHHGHHQSTVPRPPPQRKRKKKNNRATSKPMLRNHQSVGLKPSPQNRLKKRYSNPNVSAMPMVEQNALFQKMQRRNNNAH